MLSKRKLQNCVKEPKYLRANLYKTTKKVGQKAVNKHRCTGEQCLQVAKIGNLRNFAGCEILQPTKFAGCQIFQPSKFQQFAPPSSINLLRISPDLIMSL